MTPRANKPRAARSRTRLLAGLLAAVPLITGMHSHEPSAPQEVGPAAQVVALTNEARAAGGCGPLKISAALTKSAQNHAVDMATHQYMSHTSRDGRSPSERMRAAGAPGSGYLAENIAEGQRTPEAVVSAWLRSPGHRKNIENCRLTWIGVGVSGTQSRPYWVQNFAG